MKGRTPTKAEKEHMQKVREVGCICCIVDGKIAPYEVPSEYTAIHHINGKTRQGAHFEVLPLCSDHHQYGEIAVHKNKFLFCEKYGQELELLTEVEKLL